MSWHRNLEFFGLGLVAAFGGAATAGPLAVSYAYTAAGRLVGEDYGANQTVGYAYDAAGNLLEADWDLPSLEAVPAGVSHLTLVWAAFPGGFLLETTGQLGPGAIWQAVTASAVQFGDQFSVTVPLATTAYYRLRKP